MPTVTEYQELRERFFNLVYPDGIEGYICIATRKQGTEAFEQRFFEWPSGQTAMHTFIERKKQAHDVWYCPHLLDAPVRKKAHSTIACQVLWADLDECDPHLVQPPPSIIVESSPGRYQGLWRIDPPLSPDQAEIWNKRIAYKYVDQGADTSGWDLTQLLRVPYTYNYKDKYDKPFIDVLVGSDEVQTLDDFSDMPTPPVDPVANGQVKNLLLRPEKTDLPPGQELIEKFTRTFPAPGTVWRLFRDPLPKGERSEACWRLAMECIDAGMSRDQVFAVCYDAACNKFREDGRDPQDLWSMVLSAFETNQRLATADSLTLVLPPFYDSDELQGVGRTILDDYVDWAKKRTDAAEEYHLASGLMIMSTLFSGFIRVPVPYQSSGVVPNLWIMILAPSTVTRKSTAMRMAKNIIEEVDNDLVALTDATPEGLFQVMSTRPGMSSLFYRDEITGLIGSAGRKDYMKGIIEGLIQMYDNENINKQLSRHQVRVNNPIMPMFSGGIKDKMYSMLEEESISSGFMPRMIIVSADVGKLKRKKLGPPTDRTSDGRGELIREFRRRYEFLKEPVEITVAGQPRTLSRHYDAVLTEEAWERIDAFDELMTKTATGMTNNLASTMIMRFTEKTLKIAALLAAIKRRPEGREIRVEKIDIVQALSYLQQWLPYTVEAIEHIGDTHQDKNVRRVHRTVIKHPNGISRGDLMNEVPLSAPQMREILDTLQQRGLIDIHKGGRSPMIIPRRRMEN